jgi:hypothetical protein
MAGTDHLKRRLGEIGNAPTAVSSMTWSTPWGPDAGDSVIRQGYKNRNLEIKQLELQPGIEPGTYTLRIDKDSMTGPQWIMDLMKDGRKVASTRVAWMTRINHANHYTVTFKDRLSLVIGRSDPRGGSTIAGIGQLLDDKPLVVGEKR